ncbi:hypothetical protein PU629_07215 [Pullulanibacillus sp. KACC 23026]|uniref:hypothetical protein n=1 Tax=Pullulanibacillus sp. KACC 23026 TaxID=3028315 RepID=UPI0023B05B34|nr:hypothetical protein [Pullulanibacillus sp. KACC 23026]WEG14146.1 hypothetical protein PU629_07215 [Pullulanibacillus sp. KACC 23026]
MKNNKKRRISISPETVREICLVIGFILLIYGIYQIYKPASFIVGGILILWIGLPPKAPRNQGGGE